MRDEAIMAIEFALKQDNGDNSVEFLRAWRQGTWQEEWPEFDKYRKGEE